MKQKPLISRGVDEKGAKEFLEALGYVVTSPKASQNRTTNSRLIQDYYVKLNAYYAVKGEVVVPDPAQERHDAAALQRFQTKAESLNHSKEAINRYLLEGINLLFDNAHELDIYPPKTFQSLVSKNHAWIFSKVAQYVKLKKREAMEKHLETVYNQDDETLIKIREERERKILGEDDNG